VHARVTRVIIDSPADYPLSHKMLTGQNIPYETIAGRAVIVKSGAVRVVRHASRRDL